MHLGHSPEHRQYKIKDGDTEVVLDTCMEEKDLGVWTDNKLEFTEHIWRICMKGDELLGLVKKSFAHKDPEVVKKLYTALVTPHL